MSGTSVAANPILRSTSTNLDPRYLASQFVPTVTLQYSDGTQDNVLEVFSPKMVKAIESLQAVGFDYFRRQPITTTAFKRFNNTSCWWMIILASKQLHPLAIADGDLLLFPNIELIRRSQSSALQNAARVPKFVDI